MALFAFLRPDKQRLDHLERVVEKLIASEEARQVAFLDIAERVKRHLSRTAAIEQRTKQAPDADPVTTAVLLSKFSRTQNGG